jgi:hypothetical protein
VNGIDLRRKRPRQRLVAIPVYGVLLDSSNVLSALTATTSNKTYTTNLIGINASETINL